MFRTRPGTSAVANAFFHSGETAMIEKSKQNRHDGQLWHADEPPASATHDESIREGLSRPPVGPDPQKAWAMPKHVPHPRKKS